MARRLNSQSRLSSRLFGAALAAAFLLAGCGKLAGSATASARSEAIAAAQAARGNLDAWRDENVYFILTDRFSDGDATNNFNVDKSNPQAYHGGDFQGILNKLPYIKSLGATTIWITPINDNKDDSLVGKYWGYHGYWTKNWEAIDEHLGTDAKFAELVAAAHAMGIKVMLDVVCNHMGYDAPWTQDATKKDWFHHNGDVQDWNNQWQLENCNVAGLPDMNTENPDVIKYLDTMWSNWITKTHVDAFRVDTVKHVAMPFWSQFTQAIHKTAGNGFFMVGEVLNGDPNYLAPYQTKGGFDSLFDYPMYYTIADTFARGGSMRALGARLQQDGAYGDATMLSPILDNHDMPRFLTVAGGDERKLRLALAFLYTLRGVPTLYMGTECGMSGGDDPDNRKDMAFGQDSSLTQYVSQLMHLRLELTPLRRGKMLEMWQDDQVYGYTRISGGQEVITILNNSDQAQSRDIQLRAESTTPNGTVFLDRLGSGSTTVNNRVIHVELGPKQARIFAVGSSMCRTEAEDTSDLEAKRKSCGSVTPAKTTRK